MTIRALLIPILANERLTCGLDDAEARLLIDWLIDQTERKHAKQPSAECVQAEVNRLCQRARAIARFIVLWCHERCPAAALQLAATERFAWPLPVDDMDPCDLLEAILAWEEKA